MKPNPRRPLLQALTILAGAIIIAGCSEPVAQGGPAPMPEVSVVTLAAAPVSLTTELPGRISAFMVSEVRPQVGGIVKKRLFTEGSESFPICR